MAAAKQWRVLGIAVVFASLLMAMSVMAVSASSHYAQNRPACDEVGGEFTHVPGGTNTCVVEGEVGPIFQSGTAGPTGNWQVFSQTTTEATTYTWAPGNVTGSSGGGTSTVIVHCLNPGGEQRAPGVGQCPSND